MEKSLKKRRSSDRPKLGSSSRRTPRLDTHTDAMVYLQTAASMIALQKAQQAAERVRCRYLHPTNGQKLVTPVGLN
jgi:aminoglycoside phosphotransferase